MPRVPTDTTALSHQDTRVGPPVQAQRHRSTLRPVQKPRQPFQSGLVSSLVVMHPATIHTSNQATSPIVRLSPFLVAPNALLYVPMASLVQPLEASLVLTTRPTTKSP